VLKPCVNVIVAALLAFGLCVTAARAQPRATAVDEEISTTTETVAGDTLLPESHIVVGAPQGQSSFFGRALGIVGGGIGGLIGSAVDNSRAQSAAKETVGSAVDMLRLKWFKEMNEALQQASENEPQYKVTTGTAEDPGVKIRVFTRLSQSKPEGPISATMTARTRQKLADSDKEARRDYVYIGLGAKAMTGEGSWTAQGPTSLRETTDLAVKRLAEVIVRDLSAAYAAKYTADDLKTVSWKAAGAEQVASFYAVDETVNTLVLFPSVRGKPFRGSLLVVDKAWLEKNVTMQ
jgi:hypothetical protein